MRVTSDPKDSAFDPHNEKRRVWHMDSEVTDWAVADEFRRVVITKSGRVLNGAVRIERLTEDPSIYEPAQIQSEIQVHQGFVGLGMVHVPDQPVPTTSPAPAPAAIVHQDPSIDSDVYQPTSVTYLMQFNGDSIASPEIPEIRSDVIQSELLPDENSQE